MRLMKAGGARAVKRVLVVLVAMMMVQVLLLGRDSLTVRANNKACVHCVILSGDQPEDSHDAEGMLGVPQ